MKKYQLKKRIYRSLKQSPKTPEDLVREIGNTTKKEILNCIQSMIKDGWVEKYGGVYRLRYVFNEPLGVPKESRDWSYETIQSAQGAQGRPDSFLNPYIDWIPQLDQGDRGTCVGFSARYAAWLIQLNLIDPKPKKEEVQTVQRDVPIRVWGQCTMLVDKLHEYAPSAQGLYYRSRIKENITVPSGSEIRGAVRTWKDEGYNFEKDWNTPKTSTCAPTQYPISDDAQLLELSKTHKLDGYAQITTFEGLKDAIYNYGCAIIAINIYENFENNGKVGPFPEPKGSVIGAHALCAVGYDKEYIYFLHSWTKGWSKLGAISENYWRRANSEAYAPIDSQDVVVAQQIYGLIRVTSNVPANVMFGKDEYKNVTDAKTSWELNKPCDIHIEPVEKQKYIEDEYLVQVTPSKEKPEIKLDFIFTERDDIKYKILKLINKILEKLKKK